MRNTIGELRRELGMSQCELARKLSISRVGLSNIERGIALPRVDSACKIADCFGKRVEQIFFEDSGLQVKQSKNKASKKKGEE